MSINSEKAPEPVGAYPHAKRIGDLLFLSGVGPRVKNSKKIPGVEISLDGEILSYDIKIQTHAVINNIKLILESSGLELKDLVDCQCFLTNMKKDFKKFNQVYAEYFSIKNGPCRTTVEIGALPTPIAVEFKCIAKLRT